MIATVQKGLHRVKEYELFHDGDFEGLWIRGETVHVYLRTAENKHFEAVANGVAALGANGFRKGNIVLSVSTRSHAEIVLADIRELYDLRDGPEGRVQAENLLAKARQEKLTLLEVLPSYGATCLVLAESVDVQTEVRDPQ